MQKITLHIELENNLLNMQHISSVDTIPLAQQRAKPVYPVCLLPSWEPEGYRATLNKLQLMVMVIT